MIRKVIRPQLKSLGFSRFTGRNSWRFHDDRIDVVNFQSFNSYHAEVMEITSYSFAVNLGCFYTHIPSNGDYKACSTSKDGELRPQEQECQFRASLTPRVEQKTNPETCVWYIDPLGQALDASINDVASQISEFSEPWFQQFSDPTQTLEILMKSKTDMKLLWGFGNIPSPRRSYLIGYFALKLGNLPLAKTHLSLALESGCYAQVADRIRDEISAG